MLLRLADLGVSNAFALLYLLFMSDGVKDVENLARTDHTAIGINPGCCSITGHPPATAPAQVIWKRIST